MQKRAIKGICCRRAFVDRAVRESVLIRFEDGRIGSIDDDPGEVPGDFLDATAHDLTVCPGFFDVHVHGSAGHDFLHATPETLDAISASLARGGATSCLATTTIASDDTALSKLTNLAKLIHSTELSGTRFDGIHLEGPFISRDRRGGFGEKYVQSIDLDKMRRVIDICGPLLRKVTLAPELDGADELVSLLADARIEVSVGHTKANFDLARRFFTRPNVRQVTHAFNAMEPFHHRSPNAIGAALLDPNVTLEMIPDGHHLAGPAIELLYRMKGPDRLMIVTDGTAATGLPPDSRIQSVGGTNLVSGGAVRLEDGTLAGSNLLMSDAVQRAQRLANVPFLDAITMASATPARSVHLEDDFGTIRPGLRADLTVLHADGSVAATIRDGILVHSSGAMSNPGSAA